MKRKEIDFRELLVRLLPLDELPPADRSRVQRALQAGGDGQLEQAALLALSRLEQSGALERLPVDPKASPSRVRFRTRNAIDLITLELPAPKERDGIVAIPRASLPAHANAGLDSIRRLLRLDDAFVGAEPAPGGARPSLIEHLGDAGREVQGAS